MKSSWGRRHPDHNLRSIRRTAREAERRRLLPLPDQCVDNRQSSWAALVLEPVIPRREQQSCEVAPGRWHRCPNAGASHLPCAMSDCVNKCIVRSCSSLTTRRGNDVARGVVEQAMHADRHATALALQRGAMPRGRRGARLASVVAPYPEQRLRPSSGPARARPACDVPCMPSPRRRCARRYAASAKRGARSRSDARAGFRTAARAAPKQGHARYRVAASRRHQRLKPSFLEGAQPALERSDRVPARRVAARRPRAVLAQPAQLLASLAVVKRARAYRELTDEAVAEERHLLATIFLVLDRPRSHERVGRAAGVQRASASPIMALRRTSAVAPARGGPPRAPPGTPDNDDAAVSPRPASAAARGPAIRAPAARPPPPASG